MSGFVLARILVPADFGVIVLANAMIALIALMGGLGLDTALVQNQQWERAHFNTLLTFNVLFGIVMAIAVVALAK